MCCIIFDRGMLVVYIVVASILFHVLSTSCMLAMVRKNTTTNLYISYLPLFRSLTLIISKMHEIIVKIANSLYRCF